MDAECVIVAETARKERLRQFHWGGQRVRAGDAGAGTAPTKPLPGRICKGTKVVSGMMGKRHDKVEGDLRQGKLYVHIEVIPYIPSAICPIGDK